MQEQRRARLHEALIKSVQKNNLPMSRRPSYLDGIIPVRCKNIPSVPGLVCGRGAGSGRSVWSEAEREAHQRQPGSKGQKLLENVRFRSSSTDRLPLDNRASVIVLHGYQRCGFPAEIPDRFLKEPGPRVPEPACIIYFLREMDNGDSDPGRSRGSRL